MCHVGEASSAVGSFWSPRERIFVEGSQRKKGIWPPTSAARKCLDSFRRGKSQSTNIRGYRFPFRDKQENKLKLRGVYRKKRLQCQSSHLDGGKGTTYLANIQTCQRPSEHPCFKIKDLPQITPALLSTDLDRNTRFRFRAVRPAGGHSACLESWSKVTRRNVNLGAERGSQK